MPRFTEIYDAQTMDHKSEASALNERAHAAGWDVLHPGDLICLDEETPSIVISGLTWSKPDLEVLDELAKRDTCGTRVWFFNPDYVFPDERILPAAPRFHQTPVMVEYAGKRLAVFSQGRGVIDRIRKLFPTISAPLSE